MADLNGIGQMLQGIGAGFSGNLPQYQMAQVAKQEQDALADDRRRKALIRDFATGYSMLNSGQIDQATQLFGHRLEMLQKLKAPDVSDTKGIYDRLISGDPAKIEEAKSGLQSFVEAAIGSGEYGGGSSGARQIVSQGMVIKDSNGNMFYSNPVTSNQPGGAQTATMTPVVPGTTFSGQVAGIVQNSTGVTPGESIGLRGQQTSAEEAARLAYEAQRAAEAARGQNTGDMGLTGGPSKADVASDVSTATSKAERDAAQAARLVKAKQVYTPFGTQLTALRDAFKGTGTGPLVGQFSGYTSSSQKALAARDIMSPMLKQVVRDSGEGTFAKNDQDQIDAMMPKETDLPEVVDYKIGLLDTFVRGKLGVPNETPSPVVDWNNL